MRKSLIKGSKLEPVNDQLTNDTQETMCEQPKLYREYFPYSSLPVLEFDNLQGWSAGKGTLHDGADGIYL